MRARTILLLGIPAVIAAVSVAVPALAGSSSQPVQRAGALGHASATTKKPRSSAKTRCYYTGKGKHQTRICQIAGPAGPRGPRGFVGSHGKRGGAGPVGATGPTGPGGVARAYALVSVKPTLQLVPALTREFTAVTPASLGVYCLTAATQLRPSELPAAVSSESSYSTFSGPGVVGLAVLNAQHPSCAANEFEVETFKVKSGGPELSNEVAFSIVVP
jgi:hypothetical protein